MLKFDGLTAMDLELAAGALLREGEPLPTRMMPYSALLALGTATIAV